MRKFFKQLATDFTDKDYAHSYMEEHAVSRLAAQIHALRKQRGWSQQELSDKSGLAQERISKIESANFSSLTMKTLQKLSRAFDVHLHITFEPFSKGIVDIGNLHTEQLEVIGRPEDLETAFSSENEIHADEVPNKAITKPAVFKIMGHGEGNFVLVAYPMSLHAFSNSGEQHFHHTGFSIKAANAGVLHG